MVETLSGYRQFSFWSNNQNYVVLKQYDVVLVSFSCKLTCPTTSYSLSSFNICAIVKKYPKSVKVAVLNSNQDINRINKYDYHFSLQPIQHVLKWKVLLFKLKGITKIYPVRLKWKTLLFKLKGKIILY